MAECRVRLQCGRVWLEVDASGVKEAIKAMAEYTEVFAERVCGQCGREELTYEYRQDSAGHDYYSLKCLSCGAQLDFGQHKVGGTLFAKRKLPSGEYDGGHQGWYKWSERKQRQPDGSPEW